MSPIYSFVHPAESDTKGGKQKFAASQHAPEGIVKADIDLPGDLYRHYSDAFVRQVIIHGDFGMKWDSNVGLTREADRDNNHTNANFHGLLFDPIVQAICKMRQMSACSSATGFALVDEAYALSFAILSNSDSAMPKSHKLGNPLDSIKQCRADALKWSQHSGQVCSVSKVYRV